MSRTYETAIKIGAAISRSFTGDTNKASDALKKLTAQTKALREAEKAAAAYKKLDDELGRSRTKYNEASTALRKMKEAEQAAGVSTKDSAAQMRVAQRASNAAAKQLDRASKAAVANGDALRKLGVDTAKLTQEQERLAKAAGHAEAAEKAFGNFQAARTRMFGGEKPQTPLFEKAGTQMRGIASDAIALGTAAFGAAAGLGAIAFKAMKTGDEIGDTADKLGISTKALQELRYGAEMSGAEVGTADKMLAKMAISIGKVNAAGKGGGGALSIPGLQRLGAKGAAGAGAANPYAQLKLNQAELAKLKPEEQFKRIAEAVSKLKTHSAQAAVATEIFGKGATDGLAYLKLGAAGIEKLSAAANKYGGVLSQAAIDAANDCDNAMRDAGMAFKGVTSIIGSELLPVVTDSFKQFSEWVASNREQIRAWAQSAAKWIVNTGLPAFKKIATSVQDFAVKVGHLIDTFGAGNLVVAGLVGRFAPLGKTLVDINVQIAKAALNWGKYTDAAKAAGSTGNLPGFSGDGPAKAGVLMGKAAAAAMFLEAAMVGYAMGTALDKWIGASDWFGKLARLDEDKKDKAFDAAYGGKGIPLNLKHNLSNPGGDGLAAMGVPRLGVDPAFAMANLSGAMAGKSGGGVSIHVGAIHVASTHPRDIHKATKKLAEHVIGELHGQEHKRRRTSMGQ